MKTISVQEVRDLLSVRPTWFFLEKDFNRRDKITGAHGGCIMALMFYGATTPEYRKLVQRAQKQFVLGTDNFVCVVFNELVKLGYTDSYVKGVMIGWDHNTSSYQEEFAPSESEFLSGVADGRMLRQEFFPKVDKV